MSLSEKDILLIEKFIDNDLSGEEREIFDQRIKDSEFNDELRFQERIAKSIHRVHHDELKAGLKAQLADKNYSNDGHVGGHKKANYIYWAAAVIVFICVGYYAVFNNAVENSPAALFVSYYKPYPVTTATRGQFDGLNHPALKKYHVGEYQQAAVMLEELVRDRARDFNESFLQLLLGNCYLNTGRLEEAKHRFLQVKNSGESIFRQHGGWYYALTLLKEDSLHEAASWLKEIETSGSVYSRQARELRSKLEEVN